MMARYCFWGMIKIFSALPGGKIEDKDSLEDTILREIFQETGLNLTKTDITLYKEFPYQEN